MGERVVEAHAHRAHALALHRLGQRGPAAEAMARARSLATATSHHSLLTRTASPPS